MRKSYLTGLLSSCVLFIPFFLHRKIQSLLSGKASVGSSIKTSPCTSFVSALLVTSLLHRN